MSIAAEIAPHLPYLRRFSRALNGTQAGGDAYVIETLEALIEDPSSFPKDMPARLGLYHVFLNLWSGVSLNLSGGPESADEIPDQRLELLTPRSRQAFLLTAVEGFSHDDAATVMGVKKEELEALVDQAAHEIASQVATSVMIIEDEPIIALDLQSIVEELGHTIAGVARTHKEALVLGEASKPGLILADIQLADGSSGLNAVNDILTKMTLPIIFITAYPERLLTGATPEPAFLITKPFKPESVKATISQALFFNQQAVSASL